MLLQLAIGCVPSAPRLVNPSQRTGKVGRTVVLAVRRSRLSDRGVCGVVGLCVCVFGTALVLLPVFPRIIMVALHAHSATWQRLSLENRLIAQEQREKHRQQRPTYPVFLISAQQPRRSKRQVVREAASKGVGKSSAGITLSNNCNPITLAMSFFDDPRSGGPSSSSRSPVVVKPKIIKTITRVLPPSPSGAKRRVEQLSSPRRDNHPSSAPSKRKSQASSRDTPKRAKVEKKRRRTPTPSSSSSSESGDEVGALNGASTQRTEEDDLAWWSTSLAKRDIFNVNALNGDEETELRWEGFISSRSVVENNLSKYRACE